MNQALLQAFLTEEVSDHVRQLLLRYISECRSGTAKGSRRYEFNRFNVTIDCDLDTVTVEDDLNVDPSGQGSWPLEEFSAALWR